VASKLVDMKVDAKARAEKQTATVAMDAPEYPWGLSLTLDEDALAKLKLEELPEVEESYMLVAKVKVTAVRSDESRSGKNRSVSLQVTAMCLEEAPKGKSAAATIYGSDADD